jgi:hypothetical protein
MADHLDDALRQPVCNRCSTYAIGVPHRGPKKRTGDTVTPSRSNTWAILERVDVREHSTVRAKDTRDRLLLEVVQSLTGIDSIPLV